MSSGNLKKKIFRNIIIALFIISLMISAIPALASAATIEYNYDDDGQVTETKYVNSTKIEYAYDTSGNRTQKTVNLYPNITSSLSSLDFGSTHVSETSSAQTVTITNAGLGNLIMGAVTITGANPSEFIKQTDTCSNATIPVSGTCQIQAVFSPVTAGAKTAALSIPSNDPDTATLNIALEGIGTAILTVAKAGTSTGTVTSSPAGINCGPTCSASYSGDTVTLTAQADTCATFAGWSGGGCTGTGTCIVTMNADTAVTATFNMTSPVADFSGTPVSGSAPLTVNFTDLSTCATSWSWDFGDTGTGTTQNPSHIYAPQFGSSFAVSYTVTLTASNANGSNAITKTSYITAQCPNYPVKNLRTGIGYSSLNSAYSAAVDGDTIQSHAVTFTENLTIGKALTLDGGYDCAYTSHIGTTVLSGSIDIISGTVDVTIDNFDIQ